MLSREEEVPASLFAQGAPMGLVSYTWLGT